MRVTCCSAPIANPSPLSLSRRVRGLYCVVIREPRWARRVPCRHQRQHEPELGDHQVQRPELRQPHRVRAIWSFAMSSYVRVGRIFAKQGYMVRTFAEGSEFGVHVLILRAHTWCLQRCGRATMVGIARVCMIADSCCLPGATPNETLIHDIYWNIIDRDRCVCARCRTCLLAELSKRG